MSNQFCQFDDIIDNGADFTCFTGWDKAQHLKKHNEQSQRIWQTDQYSNLQFQNWSESCE